MLQSRTRKQPKTQAQYKAEALYLMRLREQQSQSSDDGGFERYQSDPLGFIQSRLHVPIVTDPVKRVIESVRDNKVTIAVSANSVGKSHIAARLAVWFYKTYPDSQVYTTAAPPEKNLKNILWGEIGAVLRQSPELFADDQIYNDMNVKRNSLSFITGVAIPSSGTPAEREAKFSGKHCPHMLFIVDEGDAVPLEVYRGIESCMSGGMVRLLIMFNPRADRGAVAQMVKKKQGNIIYLTAFEHPNVITGEDIIPGAVSREITIERINEMTEPVALGEAADIECFLVPEFLVGATGVDKSGHPYPPLPSGWRRVRSPEFFYKVLGKYPPQSEMQLISRAWVDAAISRYMSYVARFGEKPPPLVTPVIGIDVSDGNSATNDRSAMAQRWGGWVAPIRAWKESDADRVAIKSVDIIKHINVPLTGTKVKVDGTGVGAGVAPRMQRLGITLAERVMVASSPTIQPMSSDGIPLGEFMQLRDQLWWSTMLWLRDDPGAMLPPDEELIEELTTPSYEINYNNAGKVRVSGKDFMKESLGRSPDKAESLILTFAPDAPTAGAW